jgi:hypothetical protein
MAAIISPRVNLFGITFNVDTFEEKVRISFQHKTVKGTIANRGRFNGHEYPYSSVSIVASDIEDMVDNDARALDVLMDFILLNRILILSNDDIQEKTFDILVECKTQCNWSLTKEQIKKLSELEMDVLISHM